MIPNDNSYVVHLAAGWKLSYTSIKEKREIVSYKEGTELKQELKSSGLVNRKAPKRMHLFSLLTSHSALKLSFQNFRPLYLIGYPKT